jgi:PAS domain S-box-containing protein
MFSALAETIPAAIFVQRGDRLLYVNPAAETLTGYSREELLANDVWRLLPEEERAQARIVYDARRRGLPVEVPARREQRLLAKDGRVVWVDVSIGRIDWAGASALLGTAFDVSERRRAEAARRRGDRRYRAMVEHTSDVILIFDAAGVMTYVGPSIEGILGHPAAALEGRDVFELVHPDDQEVCRAVVTSLLSVPGRTARLQYRVRHADGSWRWMDGIGSNLLDEPAIRGVIVNARDVTEWRAAEDQLCESEARFALAVDGAKDGIWDWNIASGAFFVSPRMREMLGVDADADIRVAEFFADRFHPDDHARVEEGWRAHLGGTATHYEEEYRLRMTDGSDRWLLVRARTVRAVDGTPQRMIGSLTDTTARKRAEEQSRDRQAELAHVLRVGAMNEMAAGIAHEINQPLAAIVNYARGCSRRLEQRGVGDDVLEALDQIATEALRAGEVVHSLKRVVRKEPPRESLADLSVLAREAVHLMRAEAAERGIAIRVAIGDALEPVRADTVQIQQVVLNLLRNAVEAIVQQPGLIDVRIERTGGGSLRLSVSDNGRGVAPELLDRIFSPFFSTKDTGLGMGLSISRTIVEGHGGRLWAEARPGTGATFAFTLPIVRAA